MKTITALVPIDIEKHKQTVTSAFSDPVTRTDLLIAVGAGMLSSMALARAANRISPGQADNTRVLLKAGGLAVATGSLSVLYKLYTVSSAK